MADASAIAHAVDGAHTDELLTPCWLTIAEARALDIPSITRIVLEEAEARLETEGDPSRPVPFYRVLQGKARLDHL